MATRKKVRGRGSKRSKHTGARWSAEVPRRLALLLKESGLSQNQFAKRCEVAKGTMSNWLAGTVLPRVDQLQGVREAFGVTLDWLIGDELAPRSRADWPAAPETFNQMLIREILRGAPDVLRDAMEMQSVYIALILRDVRERLYKEAKILMRTVHRELGAEDQHLRELRMLARAGIARNGTASPDEREMLKVIRKLEQEARSRRMFEQTLGFQRMHYLRPRDRTGPDAESQVWTDAHEKAARDGSDT